MSPEKVYASLWLFISGIFLITLIADEYAFISPWLIACFSEYLKCKNLKFIELNSFLSIKSLIVGMLQS